MKFRLSVVLFCSSLLIAKVNTVFAGSHHTASKQKSAHPHFASIRGVSITTSPFLGLRSAWDGRDLIVNLPSINEDLRLLKHREKLEKALRLQGRSFDQRPLLEVSGSMSGLAKWSKANQQASVTDIDLSSARIDILGNINTHVLALMSLAYDNTDRSNSGARVGRSRLFLKRGFLVMGSPKLYATLGQMFLPFGRYASSMLSGSLTTSLGQTNARALLLGGTYKSFHAAAYLFNGETITSGSGVNHWGAEVDYQNAWSQYQVKFGVGYISTIADASGMQSTSGSGFTGFDHVIGTNNHQILVHQVPGADVFFEIGKGSCAFKAEYVGAMDSFANSNLSFQGNGAQPSAIQAEANYLFTWLHKPASVAVAYNKSWEALALNMPRQSWFVSLSSAYWKNTITSIEFRHDRAYSKDDVSSGQGISVSSLGGSSNAVMMQFKVHF